jgi:hypothetical protein
MTRESVILQSEREFVVYSYAASHGLLLLRSRKTRGAATRIDVLFQDVRAVEIRMWFTGIRIVDSDMEVLNNVRSNPSNLIEPGNRVYSLVGDGWQGFILGGIVSVSEDDGESAGASSLLPR